MIDSFVRGSVSIEKTRLGRAFEPFLARLTPESPEFEPWVTDAEGKLAFRAYPMAVGGKSGAGKSQLINALVGANLLECDDVMACTRGPQSVFLRAFKKDRVEFGILLTDLPGVADGTKDGARFENLHNSWMDAAGAVIYLIKVNDRALEPDERALEDTRRLKLWIALSQADRAAPHGDWDDLAHRPGPSQRKTIQKKLTQTSRRIRIRRSRVIPCSATEDYNLDVLVESIGASLARRKRQRRRQGSHWLLELADLGADWWHLLTADLRGPSKGIHVRLKRPLK